MSEESKSWYRMTRPLFNSGFEDDEFWAYGQDGFQEVLDSFIGSDVLIYDKAIGTEPQQVRAIVQQKTSDVYNSTTVRQILCNIGILRCGQYVKHDGAFWLVSSLPDRTVRGLYSSRESRLSAGIYPRRFSLPGGADRQGIWRAGGIPGAALEGQGQAPRSLSSLLYQYEVGTRTKL